jgi:hypothetical protein
MKKRTKLTPTTCHDLPLTEEQKFGLTGGDLFKPQKFNVPRPPLSGLGLDRSENKKDLKRAKEEQKKVQTQFKDQSKQVKKADDIKNGRKKKSK